MNYLEYQKKRSSTIKSKFNTFQSYIDKNAFFNAFLGLLVLLGVLGVAFDYPLFPYTMFAFAFFFLVFSNGSKNLLLICFLMPLSMLFSSYSSGVTILYSLLIITYLVRVLFLFFYSKKGLSSLPLKQFFSLSFFIFYSLIVSLAHIDSIKLISAFSFYVLLALPLSVRLDNESKTSFPKIISYVCVAVLISLCASLILALIPFTRGNYFLLVDGQYKEDFSLFSSRFSGFFVDQNEMSLTILSINCFFIFNSNLFPKKRWLWLISALSLLLCFLGQSKSYLICLFLVLILLLIKLGQTRPFLSLAITAICFFIIGLTSLLSGDFLVSTIFKRFVNGSGSNPFDILTTGRSEIWQVYIDYLFCHPVDLVFGLGVRASYYNYLFQVGVSHDFILNFIWDFGIIGSLLLVFYFSTLLKRGSGFESTRFSKVWPYASLLVFTVFALGLVITGSVQMHFVILFTELLNKENNNSSRQSANFLLEDKKEPVFFISIKI